MLWVRLGKTANGFDLFNKVFPNDSHHVWFNTIKGDKVVALDAKACRLAIFGNLHAHDVKIIFGVKVMRRHDQKTNIVGKL